VSRASIRPFRTSDAPASVRLLRTVFPEWVFTEESLLYARAAAPRRARSRFWVALSEGGLVGWSWAQFETEFKEEGIGSILIAVDVGHRSRGIGGRLYDLGEEHLVKHGAHKLVSFVKANDRAAFEFMARRGLRQTRRYKAWMLDPRAARLDELASKELAKAKEGFRLAPLRDLRNRSRELFELYSVTARDAPSDDEIGPRYREWKRTLWDHPGLDHDGSFNVLKGDQPVAFAWLVTDPDGRRAENVMTGTLSEFRGRGLARLAKMASIRWAAAAGIAAIHTDNDSTNARMLALNASLGYRPEPDLLEVAKVLLRRS
jgi:GNAT superfamily N-acetyltransferase